MDFEKGNKGLENLMELINKNGIPRAIEFDNGESFVRGGCSVEIGTIGSKVAEELRRTLFGDENEGSRDNSTPMLDKTSKFVDYDEDDYMKEQIKLLHEKSKETCVDKLIELSKVMAMIYSTLYDY